MKVLVAARRRVLSPTTSRRLRALAVHYSELAESDLVDIAAHTTEVFGPEQCELYLNALEEACERTLARFPTLARVVSKRPDLRSWRCQRHVIYFRLVDDGLEVVRFLHERMLPDLHLGDD